MDISNMTIREVMEATREMTIKEGGLEFMFQKIVECIENIQKKSNVTLYDNLFDSLEKALSVCPPDEYYQRQRDLLYCLTKYILEIDKPI